MPFLHTRKNLVENNEIERVLEKLGDGAAINVSGAAKAMSSGVTTCTTSSPASG